MKKGDTVYCIKNAKHLDRIAHRKGKEYIIDFITNNDIESYTYILSEPRSTENGYLGFFISGEKDFTLKWLNFSDHFVTQKQCRLLKLKKLKNCET
jgi:hypothetical protein